MEDDTVGIRPPLIQNLRVLGESFLHCQVLRRCDGIKYDPGDMFVGNVVKFFSQKFLLLNSNEYLYR